LFLPEHSMDLAFTVLPMTRTWLLTPERIMCRQQDHQQPRLYVHAALHAVVRFDI
jgi:hypothetical protein